MISVRAEPTRRTVRQVPASKAATFRAVPSRELPGTRFHLVEEIVAARDHQRRARIVLSVPDGLLLQLGQQLQDACREAGFNVGANYLDIRGAALMLNRSADGLLPQGVTNQVEIWRRGLVAFSKGEKA